MAGKCRSHRTAFEPLLQNTGNERVHTAGSKCLCSLQTAASCGKLRAPILEGFMTKLFLTALLAIATAAATLAQSAPQATATLTVIRAGVADRRRQRCTAQESAHLHPRRSHRKGRDASAQVPAGATVIDLSSSTVLPGLIDSHTHIFLWGEDPAKGGYDANILKAGIALRAARSNPCLPPRAGARLHDAARC